MITVPDAEDMDQLVFLKHLDKRHPELTKVKSDTVPRAMASNWTEYTVGVYRAAHDTSHRLYEHQHEHQEFE
jgi:hypothetical protein